MKNFLISTIKFVIVAFFFFGIGFFARPYYGRDVFSPPPQDPPLSYGVIKRLNLSGFKFIHPLLSCEVADKEEILEFRPLNELLQRQVQTEINEKKARKISVYYRGMTTGRWAGFQEEEIYPGGSLIKIPYLIAYYKLAEDHPEILNEMITYEGDFDESVGQKIVPTKKIETGKSYSIADLIYRMIAYSGNNSTVLLMRRLNRATMHHIFDDLEVPKDHDVHRQWLVTPKRFAYFFRTLYSATYLNRKMSEKALHLLSQADFKEGLVAGVPGYITVTHKFGEFTKQYSDGTIVSTNLHDCGIVYHTTHPYFLCVMAEGGSQESLKGVIARISKQVYQFVDSPAYPLAPQAATF
ncbi:MAG: serine hydrolase [Nitrospirota bacterium]